MKKIILSLFLVVVSFGISFAQVQTKSNTSVPTTADQNFHCQDTDGETWDLYELLDAGKYVMLAFSYNG